MTALAIYRVTGEVEGWGDEEWLVVAESPEDARAVWSDPENGGNIEEDGYRFLSAEVIPDDEVLEFGGGDDGWEGSLPEGGEVLSRYFGGPLDGQPDNVKATAAAWAKLVGRGIQTDPML